jgi:hypothetical protein
MSFLPAILGLSLALGLAAWAAWQLLIERVSCVDGEILKWQAWRKDSMSLEELEQINYHYHAVVGFVSCWEFVSRSGRSLSVDGHARGLKVTLQSLESQLPGFSMAEFQRQFAAGDVEDTLEVWRRPAPKMLSEKIQEPRS